MSFSTRVLQSVFLTVSSAVPFLLITRTTTYLSRYCTIMHLYPLFYICSQASIFNAWKDFLSPFHLIKIVISKKNNNKITSPFNHQLLFN